MTRVIRRFALCLAIGAMAAACGGDDEEPELSESEAELAEKDVREGAEEAAEEAAEQEGTGGDTQELTVFDGIGSASSAITVSNVTVNNRLGSGSAVVSFDGTLGSAYTATVTFTGWGASGLTGSVNLSLSAGGQYSLSGNVTWKGKSLGLNYNYTKTGGRVCPSGTIGGRSYSPCTSNGNGGSGTNPFANCSQSSTNVCDQNLCALKSTYDSCLQSSASAAACNQIFTSCVQSFVDCFCPGGKLDFSAVQGCSTTYSSCAANAVSAN